MWSDRKRGDIRSPIYLHLPSNLILDLAMADCGEIPETGSRMPSAHFLVPESETSTHYFYALRSEEHTSELQSLMRISYAGFCLKKNTRKSDKPATAHSSTSSQKNTIHI